MSDGRISGRKMYFEETLIFVYLDLFWFVLRAGSPVPSPNGPPLHPSLFAKMAISLEQEWAAQVPLECSIRCVCACVCVHTHTHTHTHIHIYIYVHTHVHV